MPLKCPHGHTLPAAAPLEDGSAKRWCNGGCKKPIQPGALCHSCRQDGCDFDLCQKEKCLSRCRQNTPPQVAPVLILAGLVLLGAGAARSAPHKTAIVVEQLRSAAPSFGDLRSAAPSFHDLRSAAPSFHDLRSAAPSFHDLRSAAPSFHDLRSAAPSFHDLRSAAPSFHDLRSALPSFDGVLSMPAPWPSTELSASDNASTFQEPAVQEPAATNATSNDATPPDAPGSGTGGTISFLHRIMGASVAASMAVTTFAPTVYPVVRATFCNAAGYFALVRTRRDAAIAPGIALVRAAATDGEIDTEEPDWLRDAWHKVWSSSSE